MDNSKQMVRLPRDVKEFLKAEAERTLSSQNSEIVRAVRARMEAKDEQRSGAA